MVSKSEDYPVLFELHRNGHQWRWINKPLGIDHSFTFMDETTLPYGPMEYITRQAQGDFAALDHDSEPAAGYQPGKLSQMGHPKDYTDARKHSPQTASSGRVANLLPITAIKRVSISNPLLSL